MVASSSNPKIVEDVTRGTASGAPPPPPPVAPPFSSSSAAAKQMSRQPGEVAFFKLLNSELQKAVRFFDQAQLELEIRVSRVVDSLRIAKTSQSNVFMVDDIWSILVRSLYSLNKDLLLLETYAIMTYCSFSKILKKHDKLTLHSTRVPFMTNIVNKANFAHYPRLMGMIVRCESLYDEVSKYVAGKDGGMSSAGSMENERLFINMIHRLNEQVLDSADRKRLCLVQEEEHTTRNNTFSNDSRVVPQGVAEQSKGQSAGIGLLGDVTTKSLACSPTVTDMQVEHRHMVEVAQKRLRCWSPAKQSSSNGRHILESVLHAAATTEAQVNDDNECPDACTIVTDEVDKDTIVWKRRRLDSESHIITTTGAIRRSSPREQRIAEV